MVEHAAPVAVPEGVDDDAAFPEQQRHRAVAGAVARRWNVGAAAAIVEIAAQHLHDGPQGHGQSSGPIQAQLFFMAITSGGFRGESRPSLALPPPFRSTGGRAGGALRGRFPLEGVAGDQGLRLRGRALPPIGPERASSGSLEPQIECIAPTRQPQRDASVTFERNRVKFPSH